jgi:hypothetical protein
MKAATSEIVQFNVPGHIRESNPDFINFLKHYYAYAEQDGQALGFLQNLVEYRDIDTASDFFTDLIVKQYLKEFPTSPMVDKKLLTKHIREFFEAKGSFPSYEFLINNLFGESVTREWMTEHVLRPSANEWVQDVELLVKPTSGDFTKCIGSKISCVNPIAAGFVTAIQAKTIDGELHYVIKIDHKKVVNKFEPYSTIKILKNDVTNRNSTTDADFYTGIIQPCQSRITITDPGALYQTGQKINFIGGSGVESAAVVSETVSGKIENVKIERDGSGYAVGDTITDDYNQTFQAHVSSTDGIGASIAPVMEVHSVIGQFGGYGYKVGDQLEARGIKRLPHEAPLIIEVASVDYTWAVENIRIDNTGSGYSYVNLVLYDETDDVLVANFNTIAQVGTGTTQNAIANYDSQRAAGIYDILANNGSMTLADHTYSVKANGFNAELTATLSSGVLTNVTINDGGWNYQDPIIRIVGTGYGAKCSFTKNASGKITGVTIDSGGSGYTSISVTVVERFGSGAVLVPILRNQTAQSGSIQTVNILNRGEYSQELSAYDIAFDTVTGAGTGYIADLNFRVKSLVINSSGQKYKSFRANTTDYFRPAVVQPNISGGVIQSISVIDSGSGYPSDSTITFNGSSPTGVDCVLDPVFSGGRLTAVNVTSGGTEYTAQTNLLLTQDSFNLLTESGSNLEFDTLNDAIVINRGSDTIITGSLGTTGSINNVFVEYGGSGLKTAAEVTPFIIKMVSGVGSGAVLKPVLENGKLIKVHILSSGTNYLTTDTATITGSGTGAAITPIIDDGQVIDVQITSQGSGYQYGTYAYVYGAGSNAEVSLNIDTGISSVDILDTGSGYTSVQTYNITGGTGGVIRVIPAPDGSIGSVYIVSGGSGYTEPTVTLPAGQIKLNVKRDLKSVAIVNPGTGYINPKVFIQSDSIDHPVIKIEIQNFDYSLADIKLVSQGSGYTSLPKIEVVDTSGYGSISGVEITSPGRNFFALPQLNISGSGTGGKVVAITDSIGKIRQIRFNTIGYNYDEISKIAFPTNLILTDTNVQFKVSEKIQKLNSAYRTYSESTDNIDQEDGFALLTESGDSLFFEQEYYPITDIGYIHSFDYSRSYLRLDNALDEYFFVTEDDRNVVTEDGFYLVDEEHESITEGDVIIGETSKAKSAIAKVYKASGYTEQTGTNYYNSRYLNDSGKPNVKGMRIHNNERFQDFAYVLSSPLTLSESEQYIKNVVHPAGYRMFTDVSLLGFVDLPGIQLPEQVGDDESSVYIRILTTGAVYPFQGYEFIERHAFMYRNTPMDLWKDYMIQTLTRDDLECPETDRLMIGRQEAYVATDVTAFQGDAFQTDTIQYGYQAIDYGAIE